MVRFLTKAAVLMTAMVILIPTPATAWVSPGDPGVGTDTWYYDLETHWSRPYILTLWDEGVTNGYPFPIFEDGRWHFGFNFQPDLNMTRGQLAYMMSKVFRLPLDHSTPSPWPDLHPNYSLYGRPAYGEVSAAARTWSLAPEGTPLDLIRSVRRLDSVEFILAALDLIPYSEQLSAGQIQEALAPFSDRDQIPPTSRPTVAAAVILGLIIGYNDNTLRMDTELSRAEAATILYRSCLMRVRPKYPVFHPDGDGYRETLPIDAMGLRNGNNLRWQLYITDMEGQRQAHLPPDPVSGDPSGVTWDGRGDAGHVLPDGEYLVGGYVDDRRSQTFHAVSVPIEIARRDLEASLIPPEVRLDHHFALTARTRGHALQLLVQPPGGDEMGAFKVGEEDGWTLWHLDLRASAERGLTPGEHLIEVEAVFEGAERSVDLMITVTEPPLAEGPPGKPAFVLPVLTR